MDRLANSGLPDACSPVRYVDARRSPFLQAQSLYTEAMKVRHHPRLSSVGKEWELIQGKEVCREDDSGPMDQSLESLLKEAHMATATGEVASEETNALISANKVEGTTVKNTAGEKLGSIEEIMIDKRSGKVAYAVMSFGGFLGIGDRHHPLPWGVLKYDTNLEGYVVNLDKRVLEQAPTYGSDERVDLADEAYGKKIHDYYNVPPYWI
jgi:PRC-barrel domain